MQALLRDTSNWAGTIARLGVKSLVALSLVGVVPTGARAQGLAYSFTRIADTLRNDAGLGGVQCVGMSDLGTVIVVFAPAGSSLRQLWRGDGQSFTQVETSLASLCASINDSDETAYLTPLSSGSSVVGLVKNSMGTLTTLARSDVTPLLSGPTTNLPSLSNSGSAVFMTAQGNGIAVGPAGPIVYDPSSGRVLVGGVDARDVPIAELRSSVAIVTQRPVLFSIPLRDNLTAGRPDIAWDDVLAACSAAGVDEFADELPDGYDTLIGERGVNLSGGQRQRVALARALIAGARVLVLDDPLSAVDTETERMLVDNLRPAVAGMTVLVATQRLSTVQVADRAIVLVDGGIVEDGAPLDLLRGDSYFKRLFGDELLAA